MFGKIISWFTAGRTAAPESPRAQAAAPAGQPAAADAVAPGTEIHHAADLIPKLKDDHRRLLELFGRIKQAHAAGQTAQAAALLAVFRNGLQEHLLVESVRLYVYLEHSARNDPERFALVHHFRHEMGAIGKAAVAFLAKYADLASDPQLASTFGADLDAVGGVLVERIQREEGVLYPMYEAA